MLLPHVLHLLCRCLYNCLGYRNAECFRRIKVLRGSDSIQYCYLNAGAKERIAIIGPNESGKQIADQDLAWQNLVLSKNSITEQLLI